MPGGARSEGGVNGVGRRCRSGRVPGWWCSVDAVSVPRWVQATRRLGQAALCERQRWWRACVRAARRCDASGWRRPSQAVLCRSRQCCARVARHGRACGRPASRLGAPRPRACARAHWQAGAACVYAGLRARGLRGVAVSVARSGSRVACEGQGARRGAWGERAGGGVARLRSWRRGVHGSARRGAASVCTHACGCCCAGGRGGRGVLGAVAQGRARAEEKESRSGRAGKERGEGGEICAGSAVRGRPRAAPSACAGQGRTG